MLPPPAAERPSPASPPSSRPDWAALARLIRLSNQSGTLLLMLPTLWGLFLASKGRPSPTLLAIFVAGSFLMRSAGVVLNDLADRPFDRQVSRTRSRPLASGALAPSDARRLALLLLGLAGGLLLFLNRLTLLLGPIALLLAALYPFAKRVIRLPQAMLGLAFGWGTVMAWAAVRNSLDPPVWFLYGSIALWTLAYDTIYALQDREDDVRIGVKSAAILFGAQTWLAVGLSLTGMVLLLATAGWLVGLGPLFYAALAAVGLFFLWQVRRLRESPSPEQAFTLFKQHVWAGWGILLGIWGGTV
ncbi:MAG: 4-hydroxybenzoate octaprenyltransferase [Nitrospirota bacterium]